MSPACVVCARCRTHTTHTDCSRHTDTSDCQRVADCRCQLCNIFLSHSSLSCCRPAALAAEHTPALHTRCASRTLTCRTVFVAAFALYFMAVQPCFHLAVVAVDK
eukprot:PLAT3319.1.p5 GENE.PLAT3319.1~~PLAT3319.1.p5  ORF type:complete len:105 (+),score=17.28 PLAT3319.1:5805-6119(+)